jgi:CHRD domain
MSSLESFVSAALFCLVSTGCLSTPARADQLFNATLSGANEVPANNLSAIGFVTLDLFGNNLEAIVSFSGLTTPATAIFLRCCAAAGTNGDLALRLTDPSSATSSMFNQTFDLTQSSTYNPTFLADGGSESVFLSALNAGLVYINISDTLNPGGEIRGQFEPMSTGGGGGGGGSGAVPEPGVLLSVATGLAAIATQLKRR